VQRALVTRRKVVQIKIDETKHKAPIHECETSLCCNNQNQNSNKDTSYHKSIS